MVSIRNVIPEKYWDQILIRTLYVEYFSLYDMDIRVDPSKTKELKIIKYLLINNINIRIDEMVDRLDIDVSCDQISYSLIKPIELMFNRKYGVNFLGYTTFFTIYKT